MFEMETKFNYTVLLPERHVVRLVSTQTFAVPGQSGSASALCRTDFGRRGSFVMLQLQSSVSVGLVDL